MDKRYITFFALALPIWIGGMMWIQRDQRIRREAFEEQQAVHQEQMIADGWTTDSLQTETARGTGEGATQFVPYDPAAVPSQPGAEPGPSRRPEGLEGIVVQTESYEIVFSPAGGVPTQWDIIDPEFTLPSDADEYGVQRIPLIDTDLDPYGLDRPFELVLREMNARFYRELNEAVYSVERWSDAEGETIVFTSPVTESGLQLTKTYRIPARGFESQLELEFSNLSASRLTFNNVGLGLGLTLGPGVGRAPDGGGNFASQRYTLIRPFYYDDEGISDLKAGKVGDTPELVTDAEAGILWTGMQGRYFMTAVLPVADSAANGGFIAARTFSDGKTLEAGLSNKDTVKYYPRLESYSPPFKLEPGESSTYAYSIFMGPKQPAILKAADERAGRDDVLTHILFYDSFNWMRGLCFLLMGMLGVFHGWLKSWGIAIITLVITVRLVTFPLAQIGMRQTANMQAQQAKLKPFMDKINEKHKDDPKKKNAEVMKLYREHNVNPLGAFKGCIPMVIQLPIFFALYRLLSQSFDLRGASFLWIVDLSEPDQLFSLPFTAPLLGSYFNLLPVLTSATQMLVSKLSMNPASMSDPTQAAMQKQMMYMMPVMILVMTYQFPSGLVLYWFVSNLWQLFQQQFVNKKILHPKQ